jgi:hypothetical protein
VGIPVSEIVIGKCYLTALGQVRRVLRSGNGKVTYESRGKTAISGSWGELNTVSDGRFARDVEREVPLRRGVVWQVGLMRYLAGYMTMRFDDPRRLTAGGHARASRASPCLGTARWACRYAGCRAA